MSYVPTFKPYVDGYAGAQPELTVVPEVRWPFQKNSASPDVFTREYERAYKVPGGPAYLPPIARRTSWTNLVTYSEALENAAWTKVNATPTDDVRTAPDGETTMGKLLETTASGEHSISQAATVAAVPTEFSVFVRGGLTRTWLRMAFVDSAAVTRYAFFEFGSARTGPTSSGVDSKIVALGDDYFRCVMQATPAAGAGTLKVNLATSGSTISYTGNAANGAYLWGMQVNTGLESPYVSTTSTTRTISAPDRDPHDPFAFLIGETPRDGLGSPMARVRRTFSRIPREQVVPDSQWIKKPDLPGTFPQVSGNALIVQPEPNVPRWIFYTNIAVVSDSGPPGSGAYPTGGTFTITVGANTTAALAYNASAATIQTAINGLASVSSRGVMFVTGSYNTKFTLGWTSYIASSIASSVTGPVSQLTGVTTYNINQINFTIDASGTQISGGTFTLTIFGQTTAPIAYNASLVTLAAAINALSIVGGDATWVANPGIGSGYTTATVLRDDAFQISFVVQIDYRTVTTSGASLTPSGSGATTSVATSFPLWTDITLNGAVLSQRVLGTLAAHGITAADGIIVKQGTSYLTIAPGNYLASGNIITLTAASGPAFTNSTTITTVGAATGNVYTAESKLTRIKRITAFYLIGTSPGVDSLDDVPLPTYEGDAASFLSAIFNGDTEINYEVGELDPYKDGPILQRTRTVINPQTM